MLWKPLENVPLVNALLSQVNGERTPEEVYKDFRAAVLQILGSTDDQTNGISGIPGEIVGVEPVPERDTRRDEMEEDGRASERRDKAVIPAVPIPIRQPVSLPVVQSVMPASIGNPISLPTQMQNERVITPKVRVEALFRCVVIPQTKSTAL